MEETVIVIMLKDKETGFLEKELGSYKILKNEGLIYNTYALEEGDKVVVYMKLTTDRDVEDWEFNAIYDYYDGETISHLISSIEEEEECYNPTWIISFDFNDDMEKMEEKIDNILELHMQEITSVYKAIIDKRNEY